MSGRARPGSRAVQRKARVAHVSVPGDPLEREADRAAEAAVPGRAPGLTLSRVGVTPVQRQDTGAPKKEDEKYADAAKKAGEAFLATDVGKKLKEEVLRDPLVKGVKEAGESFIGTLPGKIITGAAAVGAVSALAATHKALPVQVPEIPLDVLHPGLKVKLTWEGPVDSPSKAMITFSLSEGGGAKKTAKTATERQREENARMAADMARFREGMRYAPGTAEARQQQEDEEATRRAIQSRIGTLPTQDYASKYRWLAQPSGPSLTPQVGFKPKSPGLLDQKLELKPIEQVLPSGEPEKKKEEGGVMRKAAGDHAPATAPPIVHEPLRESGEPLDPAVRATMEARLGHDFGRVRIHAGDGAARAAREVDAHAYTVGSDIVFGAGAYDPRSPAGQRLLAHELAHVVQQREAPPGPLFLQRRSIFEDIGILFGLVEGTFDDAELRAYLDKVTKAGKIEDKYDSDNKARAIVRRWKSGDATFELLAPQKTLLIEEMLSGPTGTDDENAILDLLELSDATDLRHMFGPAGVKVRRLEEDLDGDSHTRLETFLATRFKGGRAALLKGDVQPQGAAAKGAPTFAYSVVMLRARIDGPYQASEIVEWISGFDPATREQALKDVGQEREVRARALADIDEQAAKAAKAGDTAAKDALEARSGEAGFRLARIDRVMEPLFRDVAMGETKASLLAATVVPDPARQAEIKKALKPDVKAAPTGAPLAFVSTLPGETDSYEDKVRAYMPTMIQSYWDTMVKDRGTKEHGDPTKVHQLAEFERIGNESRIETDKVFGEYKKGNVIKADRPGKRGNIHDLFADTEANLKKMSGGQRRGMAATLLFYFFQSDDGIRDINRAHHASPRFDKNNTPLNDEAKVLDKLAGEFTKTAGDVKKLNEIDRGWDASAGGGEINLQIFTKATPEKDRLFLWDMFQTLIHEYLHTLAHTTYNKHAEKFGTSSSEYNTLVEGVDSLLAETVWTNVEPRIATDTHLREQVEGPTYSKLPPVFVPHPSQRRYESFTEAVKLVNIVGIRNLYAAYFLGDVKKIGA